MQELDIKLPDVGEGVTEAELVEWHVKPGDLVREDDILAAVMTDKATVEIPSLYDGKVTWTGGEIGDTVAVGAVLVRIETEGEAVPDVFEQAAPVADPDPAPAGEKAPEPAPKPEPEVAPVVIPQVIAPRVEHADVLASPAVRKRARDAGIDLRQIRGTGPGGRIGHGDLDAMFQSAQAPAAPIDSPVRKPEVEEIKVVGLRRKIADRMALANSRIPHITVVEEVDVTGVEDLRATMNKDRGDKPKLTMLPFVCAALARAVRDHPEMNAHFDDNAGIIRRHRALHVGIATMTDNGLIVPVLRDAETRGLFDTASEIARLSEAARTGKAVREELTGSTLTITSLGPLGAIVTTPIINHPEVAIVGINKMAMRPQWDGTQFVPRKMMNISCSFDHRVIDGWDAAVFVNRIKTLLETPALIFVEE
ncbi:dihydrolipoamide acetyltransferase family protein [Aliisedimentitalea scapharcae]|uniref:Dihydrolipoamide acetyltransferase component of pyruvate dehydrogenase complex n=1 Tax=Aliisedimentitalea scapharcae TaxID=1524259 RepID=A0ABZ2XQ80_9RHOB